MSGTMRGMYGSVHSDYYGGRIGFPVVSRRKKKENGKMDKTPGKTKGVLTDRSETVRTGISTSEAVRAEGIRKERTGTESARTESIRMESFRTERDMTKSAIRNRETRVSSSGRGGAAAALPVPAAEIVKGHLIAVNESTRTLRLPSIRQLGRRISLRGILLTLCVLLAGSAAVILMLFNFETATVYGSTKYSAEQIESFITRGRLGDNTFVMALKYHHRKVEDIPFVDQIDIDIVNPTTVRVNVKEKPLDGCIYYGGKNVYFSKEGLIETVSGRTAEEATKVNGVVLTHSKTGQQILAKNQLGLNLSLEVLRELSKYGVHADEINVDEKSNLTVTFGDVDVEIGKTGYEQKMYKMQQILPYLSGKAGVISMTRFESDYSESEIVLSPKSADETGRQEEADEQGEMTEREDGIETAG